MNQSSFFSDGPELANLIINSGILHNSWSAISKADQTLPFFVNQDEEAGVIALVTSATYSEQLLQGDGGKDLIPAATLSHFDFIGTKVNASFSINKAAATAYKSAYGQLSGLKIDTAKPLVITGHSLGGSVAFLFTLWLLEKKYSVSDRLPICITFGAPLVGNDAFRKAIKERKSWLSCFLNVVSNQDPIPRSLSISPHNSDGYKPFGTFLFCSESGNCACFEDQESISRVLLATSSQSGGNTNFDGYERVLDAQKKAAMRRDNSEPAGAFNLNPLRAGITSQLVAVEIIATQQEPQNDSSINELIIKEEEARKKSVEDKRKSYEEAEKLNDMKLNMTYMEWYKKYSESDGLEGYYDCYKNPKNASERDRKDLAKKNLEFLKQYWKDMVNKTKWMPQMEGKNFRTRWLYGGTNYRRMIEPLAIAEYYKAGKTDYINSGRCHEDYEHYQLLEQWMNDDMKKGQKVSKKREKSPSLTEDSTFWARVEEAIIACEKLKREPNHRGSETYLSEFETNVMRSINNFTVSKEIFLKNSSFMRWWGMYDRLKGTSYESPLTHFMRNPSRSYA